ncbi:MAG: hypothetical protein HDS66_05815 [Bacteroidales bacterium]|nr:hypothetical protein [Bacteroidales bacterium]
MKHIIITLLFCIGFAQNVHSLDCNQSEEKRDTILNHTPDYILYKAGCLQIYIYNTGDDRNFDVLISEGKGGHTWSTTCRKTNILKWAFEAMEDELGTPQVLPETYSLFTFELSLYHGGNKLVITSASKEKRYTDKVEAKLKKLKQEIADIYVQSKKILFPPSKKNIY